MASIFPVSLLYNPVHKTSYSVSIWWPCMYILENVAIEQTKTIEKISAFFFSIWILIFMAFDSCFDFIIKLIQFSLILLI